MNEILVFAITFIETLRTSHKWVKSYANIIS